ncbi:MAG: NAD(P)/FAD-dependent oxidoreductase [Candidatus Aminicenantia bacterium]
MSSIGLSKNGRIIVIGGGPAGAFFSYYLLKIAEEKKLSFDLNIFEGKYFLRSGPSGCNFCAGVLSETLIERMKKINISLPQEISQSSVGGYCMLTRKGKLILQHPLHLRKIVTVFRGNGPLFSNITQNISFDDFLLREAIKMGAKVHYKRVTSIKIPSRPEEKIMVETEDGNCFDGDLVVGAFGLNTDFLAKVEKLGFGYKPPKVVKTCQTELKLGSDFIREKFKNFIYILNLGLKDLRFSAIIPKGDYITITLVGGKDLTFSAMKKFLATDLVKELLPEGFSLPPQHCHCLPRIAISPAKKPFTNRFVIIGDASCSRYYKNGIESALITASLAVETAINVGITEEDFKKGYWKRVKRIAIDNNFGKALFYLNELISRVSLLAESHIQSASKDGFPSNILKNILWNMFTGNIEYRKIFFNALNPFLLLYTTIVGFAILFKRVKGKLKMYLKREKKDA